jgi:hypothetical protein
MTLDAADIFFDVETVHTVELFMTDETWKDIRGNAGGELWHEAACPWGDERVERVGVHAFGNSSLTVGKPPLKSRSTDTSRASGGEDWSSSSSTTHGPTRRS